MIDVVTAEIVRNYMETTAAEIVKSLIRSAVSPIFNEAHDCSAGVFYFDGETAQIIARADATPVHIYGALTSVQACLDFFEGDLNPGDVILVSDPYYGGTHIADFTVVTPVFYDGSRCSFRPCVPTCSIQVAHPRVGLAFTRAKSGTKGFGSRRSSSWRRASFDRRFGTCSSRTRVSPKP